jgi:hypothetical protein
LRGETSYYQCTLVRGTGNNDNSVLRFQIIKHSLPYDYHPNPSKQATEPKTFSNNKTNADLAAAKPDADDKAKKAAIDKVKAQADEKAKKEAADNAKAEADKKAKKEAADKTKAEADEKAKKEVADKTKAEADEKAKKEVADRAKAEADTKAQPAAERCQPYTQGKNPGVKEMSTEVRVVASWQLPNVSS